MVGRYRLASRPSGHGRPLVSRHRTWQAGTDGFGRRDTRESLRALFEIDAPHIAAATRHAGALRGAAATCPGGQGDP